MRDAHPPRDRRPKGLGHVGLYVADMPRMLDFYTSESKKSGKSAWKQMPERSSTSPNQSKPLRMHEAQRCPAEDPSLGATLLNYLSRPNVATHGVDIRGEAVVQGEHTMYLIVEAEDEGRIRGFMEPFTHILQRAELLGAFGDETHALVMYDTDTVPVQHAPGAEYVTVSGDKITNMVIVFDRLPFETARQAAAKTSAGQ